MLLHDNYNDYSLLKQSIYKICEYPTHDLATPESGCSPGLADGEQHDLKRDEQEGTSHLSNPKHLKLTVSGNKGNIGEQV